MMIKSFGFKGASVRKVPVAELSITAYWKTGKEAG
jgi:hypothetical protein